MAGYVVVTIAPGNVVHAWGAPSGLPFETRAQATGRAKRMEREDRERHPGAAPSMFRTCKVLGDASDGA